ncbi:hypothetical protein GWL_41280 [Herbaspirillum sp. GW103]|nr:MULTISPECIES: hypothetical protein [unclassified Herbaspirillum]EIJ44689.1 hypothetical protein GWL_41280 [Herbaspirillum sp. GW103]
MPLETSVSPSPHAAPQDNSPRTLCYNITHRFTVVFALIRIDPH